MNARHLIHIREALWKRPGRGACVMVGSGLSRQTDANPPTWGALARLLQEQLQRSAAAGPGGGREPERVTARDCPRLAQEYQAIFKRDGLNSFVRSSVPDGEPGEVHERLLALPWADVFTTNWDTVLERAARGVFQRTYAVVTQPDDLPKTVAPRIVKLHGSFPSPPFVVTEEDYRTYPTRFAPFVNTVQQAFIESVFLLIGFSGDDPNFLHWCGWVRDQLGSKAPNLYLTSLRKLDRSQRLTLRKKGVFLIDLSSKVPSEWSSDVRHERAVKWVLECLEAGEPREHSWPVPPPRRRSETGLASPPPPAVQPRREPQPPASGNDAAALEKAVTTAASIWGHNRRVYPGWPILPFAKHQALSGATKPWIDSMLKVVPTLDPDHRLIVMRELIWRLELLMDRLSPSVVVAAKEAFEATEPDPEQDDDLSERKQEEVRQGRIAVALALLTDSRYDLDQASFDKWRQKLQPLVAPASDEFHRLQHDGCLWALIEANFRELTETLGTWRTENADPMWSLRKAALLVEVGDFAAAKCLALPTLQRSEQTWVRDERVATAARFGWALHWRQALDIAQWWDELKRGAESAPPDMDLWARLVSHHADARSVWNAYARQLTKQQREDAVWTFDFGRRHSFSLGNSGGRIRAAWRVIRVVELSGLSFGIPGVRMAGDQIEDAAQIVGRLSRTYAARLVLCGGTGKEEALDGVLHQVHVAKMSKDGAAALFAAARSARDFFLARWMRAGIEGDWFKRRVELAIETMSRCLTRHSVGAAVETFRWAVGYRPTPLMSDVSFLRRMNRLVERSWHAMNRETQRSVIPSILTAPLSDDALYTDKDPGHLWVQERLEMGRTDMEESIWSACVGQICAALRGSEDARNLAVVRLEGIFERHLLTDGEEREVGRNLWATAPEEETGLPDVPRVDDWAYLVLPEPEPGIAERRFRAKWIGRDVDETIGDTGAQTIRNVATACNSDHVGDRAIRLSTDEEAWFWTFAAGWLGYAARQRAMGNGTTRDHAVRRLVELLTCRRGPASVLEGLAENTEPLDGYWGSLAEQWGDPGQEFLMVAACAALGGGGVNEMESRILRGLKSSDERAQFAAWKALEWWIGKAAGDAGVPVRMPALECVSEIGGAISVKREDGSVGPLTAACAVYESGNSDFVEAIHPMVLRGLRRLRSDLNYKTGVVGPTLPLDRQWCVWLAWTMRDAGKGDHDIVRDWIKEGDEDPLCLVRFVRERYEVFKKGGGTGDR